MKLFNSFSPSLNKYFSFHTSLQNLKKRTPIPSNQNRLFNNNKKNPSLRKRFVTDIKPSESIFRISYVSNFSAGVLLHHPFEKRKYVLTGRNLFYPGISPHFSLPLRNPLYRKYPPSLLEAFFLSP